jgi:hypothetical protein
MTSEIGVAIISLTNVPAHAVRIKNYLTNIIKMYYKQLFIPCYYSKNYLIGMRN